MLFFINCLTVFLMLSGEFRDKFPHCRDVSSPFSLPDMIPEIVYKPIPSTDTSVLKKYIYIVIFQQQYTTNPIRM